MPAHHTCRRRIAAGAVTLLAACSLAAVANAVTSTDGLSQIEMRNDREPVGGGAYVAAAWGFLPGADITVTVPSDKRYLVNARFTAESTCSGAIASYCSVRIGRFTSCTQGVPSLLLQPDQGNTDFHFDSGGGIYDSEAHAMERSAILSEGTHHICVQRFAVGGASFTLDDWHFTVESSVA